MSFPNHDKRKKLLRADVLAIKVLHQQGNTAKDLAVLYGVSPECISLIVKGLRRKEFARVDSTSGSAPNIDAG